MDTTLKFSIINEKKIVIVFAYKSIEQFKIFHHEMSIMIRGILGQVEVDQLGLVMMAQIRLSIIYKWICHVFLQHVVI